MRYLIAIFFSSLTLFISASEPIKIGVITDSHYLSEKLMDEGYAINSYVNNSGKNVMASPEVLDKVVNDYRNSDIEILLVCGDLTKDGEKQSHLDFSSKLKPLHDKGIKIFVIPGNHDINMPNALRYQGNRTFKTDNISAKDFETIYADYGFKQSISRDVNSLSYVAELNSSTWLLAIDAARYDEYTTSPLSSGKIKAETEEWIKQTLNLASSQNKNVVAMMHWGAVEHFPFQATVFKDYLVEDYKRIAGLLADGGVNVVFTGHFHSNDISMFTSDAGNAIYDIETGTLVSYPFAYRLVELYDNKINITTKNIRSIPSNPKLVEQSAKQLKMTAKQRALSILKSKNLKFTENQLQRMADIAGQLFVIHLFGDEKVDDVLKQELINIFSDVGMPIDNDMEDLDLDVFPADNNLTITFQ